MMSRFLLPVFSRFSPLNQQDGDSSIAAAPICALTERRSRDRRHGGSALHSREMRLRAAAQASGLGYFDVDYTSGSSYWSPEFKEIAGQGDTSADMTLERMIQTVHPEDRSRFTGKLQASLDPEGDGRFQDEHRLLRPDGTVRWIRIQGRTSFADSPEGLRPLAASGIFLDITDVRRTQGELESSRARLAAVLDSLAEGVVVSDLEGRVLEMNPAALALHGFQDGGEARRQLPEYADIFELRFLNGCIVPLEQWPLARALRGESFADMEVELRRKDTGASTIVCYIGRPVLDSRGTPILCVLTLSDISARKAAEQALRDSEAQLRATFEQAAVGIVHLSFPDLHILSVNEALCRILGYERHELLALSAADLTHPDDRQIGAGEYVKAMAGEIPSFVMEKRYVRKDGRIVWARATLSVVRDEAGSPRFGISVIEDITERRAAEASLQRLNAELEQRVQERTAELTHSNEALLRSNMELQHFAHATAHDLQTPLRSIAGFAQLLQREIQESKSGQAHEWSARIVENTKRLQTLIRELLAYTRIEAQGLPFQAVDFGQLCEEVASSLAAMIQGTGAEVVWNGLPTLEADRSQMAQVLQNLIENGIRYNQARQPRVSVTARREGDEWMFSVADNGIGIDPRHHERIFEIFRRLHTYSQIPGTGIGLALCRRIVEHHGGRIWVESRPGEGSIFRFTLPIRPRAEEDRP